MRTRYKIIVLLIIISAVLLSTWWQDQKQRMYDRSLRSSYDYDVMLTTDSTLNNVTLYIPLPVINDTSYVGMDIIEHHFNNHDPSWEYSIVDTEHGLMLSMKNEKGKSIDLSTMVLSNQTIDTINPLGNEMVLMPKYNLTRDVNARGAYSRTSEQFDYDSKMYAYYDTSSNANVSISIYLNGRNEWWIGGWQYNSYWETMEVMLSGSQDGWTTVSGQLVTGEGTYY
ncbi:hypothetical protein MSLAZ_0832 [Methanosarcina lacustris Z-7289]|uniref:Uncharacterized protein n=1 Tax=Methanosarcina lacustris Z-7289 TaxID=1434111 RepID=A0A0E3S5A7_9EURY|nr:hypothetical protein [Methanosarcina lacustris]AKB74093.1 hypothetical protein MSLAZ_0832 [Methanosarcina lacustris Z-7289]